MLVTDAQSAIERFADLLAERAGIPVETLDERWTSQEAERRRKRIDSHLQFVRERGAAGKPFKYTSQVYGFPVITRQETELMIPLPVAFQETMPNQFSVTYALPDPADTGREAIVPGASAFKSNPAGQPTLL